MMKTEFHDNVLTEDIAYYLDGLSFIHKYNPLDDFFWLPLHWFRKVHHRSFHNPRQMCTLSVLHMKAFFLALSVWPKRLESSLAGGNWPDLDDPRFE